MRPESRLIRRLVRFLAVKVVPFASVDGLDVFFVDPDVFGGILLASEHIQDATPAEAIGTLVHEAVHLRIARWGVRDGGDRQAQIERRCLAEQVDSLLRCSLITPSTARKILDVLSTEWWTDSAHRLDLERLVRKAGLPLWSARLLEAIHGRRGVK